MRSPTYVTIRSAVSRGDSACGAADCWRRYLVSDRASEWAARARRALKFCEIQVNSLVCRPSSQTDSDRAACLSPRRIQIKQPDDCSSCIAAQHDLTEE